MIRKAVSVLLCFVLALTLFPILGRTCAASSEAEEAAQRLYELGLFSGTGTDENGKPIFDLDRAPTRHEAVTMLVRLLGKDSAAKGGNWTTPFTDVAEWAKPYVGYAYANKLTSGTSDITFSGAEPVSAAQYITFVLRALGYSSDSDFQWNKSWELSDKLGITDGRYRSSSEVFTRGDVAIISSSALDAKLKNSGDTLLETLIESGAVMSAIRPLTVVREVAELQASGGVEPFSDYWFGNTRIDADLSDHMGLAYSLTFADNTVFPVSEKLPAGFDQKALLEWGKYPGLNVDILQAHGFTGKGAVIAYVDQAITPHQQYKDANLHYENYSDWNTSMHGPTVLSMLSGKDIGTAPEAEVYYYASKNSSDADQKNLADCLYAIIEQNKKLSADIRIRMVGFSNNISDDRPNADALRAAVTACEDAGIMVWFCGEYATSAFLPGSDRNNYSNIMPNGIYYDYNSSTLALVPSSGRTGANGEGSEYIYWMTGGLSWTMPYVLGLYAIAIEIDPTLTQDQLRTMIVETAYLDGAGRKIVNPVGFVASALHGAGRDEEAQVLLDEVRARTRYLYAVMDTAQMNEEDLTAVGNYLASITDATVLIADAARFADAQSLYAAMQKDALQRGGVVAGVQIFGTASMVPAFQIGYKVQMVNGVDEGGTLLTDLFYGNFENDASMLGSNYNVMDHMTNGWDVDLIPQWPVVRLPLSKGEFAAFFRKYTSFVLDTGLERLDIVNFSNPIFQQKEHTDDMGRFLEQRMDREFHMLDVPYRLYGNLKGDYPVTNKVFGGFEAENMSAENRNDTVEFLINTHGQWDNIDNAIFVNGEEQRISLVNMDNINEVLDGYPYYMDTHTCLNGYGMENNLTTTALNGKCVGMFSATAVISNNGINWQASLSEMAKSNFYYFHYHYLKALHDGLKRSEAFFTAQREYAIALIADSERPITGEGNYQFNLYNLLAYHNFGVIEPNAASLSLCDAKGYINKAQESIQKATQGGQNNNGRNDRGITLSEGNPVGDTITIRYTITNELASGTATIHSYSAQRLDNGYVRFTVEYTIPEGLNIFVFNPPNGDLLAMSGSSRTTGERRTLVFELSDTDIAAITDGVNINFYTGDKNRCFVFFQISQLK